MASRTLIAIVLVLMLSTSVLLPAVSGAGNDALASSDPGESGPAVAVSLDTDSIDFGVLRPGETSASSMIAMTNAGTSDVTITMTVEDQGDEALFVSGIQANGAPWDEYFTHLPSGASDTADIVLEVPSTLASRGELSGSMELWFQAVPSPEADFAVDQASAVGPLTVQFTDRSANFPTSWAWDFDNDGTIDSTEQNPTHTYEVAGTYTVNLTVANSAGSDVVVRSECIEVLEEWSMFRGGWQLTGYYEGDAPDTNNVLWSSVDIDAYSESSVTVGEGKVFVYCLEVVGREKQGYIAALDQETGALLWKEKTLITNVQDSTATPVYHDGLVFTSGDGARYASNGTLKWGGMPHNTNGGPLVIDGKVYIGNWDGHKYFCLDEKTGREVWSITVVGNAQGVPSYHDGKVFLTSWANNVVGHLYCVDAQTGQLQWESSSGNPKQQFCGSAAVSGGYVYVTSYNFYGAGELYCFREADGQKMWNVTMAPTDATPAIADGKVYVSGNYYSASHITYCFDAVTGELIWSTDPSLGIGGWKNSAIVADGKVLVGTGGDALYALDVGTGDVIWSLANCGSDVAICNGVVFSVGNDGKVYAIGDAA